MWRATCLTSIICRCRVCQQSAGSDAGSPSRRAPGSLCRRNSRRRESRRSGPRGLPQTHWYWVRRPKGPVGMDGRNGEPSQLRRSENGLGAFEALEFLVLGIQGKLGTLARAYGGSRNQLSLEWTKFGSGDGSSRSTASPGGRATPGGP
jgi:hypothetical protein